ncbi:hypothetical protein [Paramagnetospirillum kuznetsovii]|uniref:hypothetical protein n=1 Tax=Paramagnetospirillum kuznetsovii TaxID=2053833 RepID=UPI0011BE958D|nr:hypothetical protein [Paramagnetospirillum kuznetsovii]
MSDQHHKAWGRKMVDYKEPKDRNVYLEKLSDMEEDRLKVQLENAKKQLPQSQWLVEAVADVLIAKSRMEPKIIRDILIECARGGETITYKKLGEKFGKWPNVRFVLQRRLDPVCQLEQDASRPMLSSIIVDEATGMCGKGFTQLAKDYGHVFQDADQFQKDERQRVFDYWKTH